MKNTSENRTKLWQVMANLRAEGVKWCCVHYTNFAPHHYRSAFPPDTSDVYIRVTRKDGSIWEIHDIKTHPETYEAIVTEI